MPLQNECLTGHNADWAGAQVAVKLQSKRTPIIICDIHIWKVLRKVKKEWICSLFGLPRFANFCS